MQERLKRTLWVLALAVVGVGVSGLIEKVHRQLAADVNYASFCNVSARVNCDVVLGSSYASLAGVSMGLWAILFYLTVIGFAGAMAATSGTQRRDTMAKLMVVLAVWGLLFSVYLAFISFAVLHAVCLMCSTLYLVNIGLFVCTWRLRRSLRPMARRPSAERAGQDRLVVIGSVAAAVAILVIGSWEAFGRAGNPLDAAAIARQRPEFYRWYFAQPLVPVPPDANHVRGSANAGVTIVEFSDFECGHCAAFHASVEDVLRRLGQGVRVVFRHFPLDAACNPKVTGNFHPQACLAAVAAECAGEQAKFWQYHNLLFDNQPQLDRQALIAYAARLGLDSARFTTCLDGQEARARVDRDAKEGAALGIDSTPTVFINGRLIKGALDSDLLAAAVTLARTSH